MFLRSLGGLSLENHGRPIVGAGAQPARLAMLSVIALSGPQGVSRDRLLALLWPESDADHARGALNQALYALRRDVGEQALTLGTAALRLNPEVISSDVGEFERAVDGGELESAVRLYGGPFLDGVHVEAAAEFDSWIETQRERLAQRYIQALERLARDASARGDRAAAVEWWRRLAAVDPVRSKTALGLAQALAAAGDAAGAVLHAARHGATLRTELDLPSDPALTAFVTSLRTAPSPEHSAPPIAPSPAGMVPAPEAVAGPSVRHRARRSGIMPIAAAAVAIAALATMLARRGPDHYTVGRATQVTFEPGLEIEPALSPDGRMVAYAAGPLAQMRIYLRQPGGRAVPVTADSGPSQRRPLWSPDGTRLLFLSGPYYEGDLAVVPALGGAPWILARGDRGKVNSAAWAPDGRLVAFVRGESLYVQPAENGEARAIAGYNDMFALAWSPDGRHIAFAAGNGWFAVGTDLGNSGRSEILVVPANGGRPVVVTDRSSLNVSPVWSPDSRRLLFVSNRDGPRDIYGVRVDAEGRPAGQPVRLTVGLSAHSIALSADGRRIAYSVFLQRANIWSLAIESSPVSQSAAAPVTRGSQVVKGLAISRDGKRLYFDSDREGNGDIYRLALPAGEPEQLTRNSADNFFPSVSPDGRWIAFHTLRYGTRDIMVMPADGGTPERVTSDLSEEMLPTWSPDSRSVAYVLTGGKEGGFGLYVTSRDSSGRWGERRRVSRIAAAPAWSPDGRTLLFASAPGSGAGVIWAVPAAGGQPRVFYAPRPGTDDPIANIVQWTPDGRRVFMKSHDRNDVASFWSLPAGGGRPRLVARLEDPSRPSPREELATDGKRIYFVIYERQSDIYVADLSGL